MKTYLRFGVKEARVVRLYARPPGSTVAALALGCLLVAAASAPANSEAGWLNWRGPGQNGCSSETGLPDRIGLTNGNLLWQAEFPGRGAPVIADGRVYVTGYIGTGPDLQEGLACYDAETGKLLWRNLYNDYLSDTIYQRYASSSPTIDPETGHIYFQGTQGLLAAFTRDGRMVWKHDLMETFGRLTFPNGRTASPVIDREFVVTRGITANWGTQGPGADRFYAFDKNTGELAWSSSPADRPRDNSFSHPVLGWLDGRRVFYAATGDGSLVCVNARTGDPIWRIPLFKSGINASVLVHQDEHLMAVFGTPYELGQMVALKIPHVTPTNATAGPVVLDRAALELWTCEVSSSTSSPILVGDRIYLVAEKGDLWSVDAHTGKCLWKLKLGIEQRNACPLYADGRLYVPLLEDPDAVGKSQGETGKKGAFYIIEPSDEGGRILCHAQLEGRCFGTPTAYRGKIYFQTTSYLYCFGQHRELVDSVTTPKVEPWPKPGPPTQLQIIPAEVLLHPGQVVRFRVRSLDRHGLLVNDQIDPRDLHWSPFLPSTAKVKSRMLATFQADGSLVADAKPVASAGAFVAEHQGLQGYLRGRVLPDLPIQVNFDDFTLDQTTTNTREPPTPFAYPPLPWIGARFKFEVRDYEGAKVLAKTIDNKFFQRAFVFIGHPDAKNYTIQAEVMSDGNRRKMSDVGVINQRYLILLKGNEQTLEITSNQELYRYSIPFPWLPRTWYMLKARVNAAADGSGKILAKAWKRGEPEPTAWTLEVPHRHVNLNGSPGLFGFAPQEMRVYLRNLQLSASTQEVLSSR